MKDKREMVNRSCQDRRQSDVFVWTGEERRKKDEKRELWQRVGKWRSMHKPVKLVNLSHSALL